MKKILENLLYSAGISIPLLFGSASAANAATMVGGVPIQTQQPATEAEQKIAQNLGGLNSTNKIFLRKLDGDAESAYTLRPDGTGPLEDISGPILVNFPDAHDYQPSPKNPTNTMVIGFLSQGNLLKYVRPNNAAPRFASIARGVSDYSWRPVRPSANQIIYVTNDRHAIKAVNEDGSKSVGDDSTLAESGSALFGELYVSEDGNNLIFAKTDRNPVSRSPKSHVQKEYWIMDFKDLKKKKMTPIEFPIPYDMTNGPSIVKLFKQGSQNQLLYSFADQENGESALYIDPLNLQASTTDLGSIVNGKVNVGSQTPLFKGVQYTGISGNSLRMRELGELSAISASTPFKKGTDSYVLFITNESGVPELRVAQMRYVSPGTGPNTYPGGRYELVGSTLLREDLTGVIEADIRKTNLDK